ncbi:hypothetical protein LTR05_004074 [Lithohypha guttulata]|uniref:Uncharacterized protein n=1 Tax=Lithohypha guttulata TaxID=1690604 RepID=A0AAN7T2C4_9EURO|nr:hypothetical protein LTR05_004074 [Lithohypha guttulata]
MYITKIAPAALLITLGLSSPVNHISKRQLGGLTGILEIVKDILPATGGIGGVGSGIGSGSGGSNIPGVPDTDNDDTPSVDTSCVDAISKIDEALTISAQLMEASGEQPTMQQILAVLGVLEDSLGDECKEDDDSSSEDDMDDMEGMDMLTVRAEECSACEQALYEIVKQLQNIFSIGQAATDVLPDTGDLPSAGDLPSTGGPKLPPLVDNSKAVVINTTMPMNMTMPVNTTTNSNSPMARTVLSTPQLRRRIVAGSRRQ